MAEVLRWERATIYQVEIETRKQSRQLVQDKTRTRQGKAGHLERPQREVPVGDGKHINTGEADQKSQVMVMVVKRQECMIGWANHR